MFYKYIKIILIFFIMAKMQNKMFLLFDIIVHRALNFYRSYNGFNCRSEDLLIEFMFVAID